MRRRQAQATGKELRRLDRRTPWAAHRCPGASVVGRHRCSGSSSCPLPSQITPPAIPGGRGVHLRLPGRDAEEELIRRDEDRVASGLAGGLARGAALCRGGWCPPAALLADLLGPPSEEINQGGRVEGHALHGGDPP
jgi:hypothetical protein